ncbi:MAG: 2OG-Fe(II) oxygenase [Vulcanimicrobiota bacterium]
MTRNLLTPGELSALQSEVLNSPYLAPEALNTGQTGTYGYTIVFRRSSILRTCREMPALRPYLEKSLDGRCNAFFINPLVISLGQHVAAHADCSLGELTEVPFPIKTSVLYLRVPSDLVGGRLSFYLMGIPVARVSPLENTLVEFPGAVRHSVEKVKVCGAPRVSLVCEQYILKPQVLEKIPEYLLRTEAPGL